MAPVDISAGSLKDVLDCILIAGPSLRACLKCLQYGLDAVEKELMAEIHDLDLSVLERIFGLLERSEQANSTSLTVDSVKVDSFRIFTCINRRGDATSSRLQLRLASDWIFSRLLEEFAFKRKKESQNFMEMFLRHTSTKSLHGYFLEKLAHFIIAGAYDEWKNRCVLTEFFPHPKAEHEKYNPSGLRLEHLFQQRLLHWYTGGSPPPFHDLAYYVPEDVTNPTFDAVTYSLDLLASDFVREVRHVPFYTIHLQAHRIKC